MLLLPVVVMYLMQIDEDGKLKHNCVKANENNSKYLQASGKETIANGIVGGYIGGLVTYGTGYILSAAATGPGAPIVLLGAAIGALFMLKN